MFNSIQNKYTNSKVNNFNKVKIRPLQMPVISIQSMFGQGYQATAIVMVINGNCAWKKFSISLN